MSLLTRARAYPSTKARYGLGLVNSAASLSLVVGAGFLGFIVIVSSPLSLVLPHRGLVPP